MKYENLPTANFACEVLRTNLFSNKELVIIIQIILLSLVIFGNDTLMIMKNCTLMLIKIIQNMSISNLVIDSLTKIVLYRLEFLKLNVF